MEILEHGDQCLFSGHEQVILVLIYQSTSRIWEIDNYAYHPNLVYTAHFHRGFNHNQCTCIQIISTGKGLHSIIFIRITTRVWERNRACLPHMGRGIRGRPPGSGIPFAGGGGDGMTGIHSKAGHWP